MMISPETYVDRYKDAPYTDLIKARDELIAELQELEDYFLNPPAVIEFFIDPGPDVRYQCCLDYLETLNSLMCERVRELIGNDFWNDEGEDEE